MNESKLDHHKLCPVCDIRITNNAIAHFCYGAPGSLDRLAVRVCQYAKKTGCINIKQGSKLDLQPCDYYPSQTEVTKSDQALYDRLATEITSQLPNTDKNND